MTQRDEILKNIYRISSVGESGFSFNQYLVKDEKNILVHTGAVSLFKEVSSKIGEVLDVTHLDYIFISHFESDECGALCNFLKLNPNLIPICSIITARQLQGFGLHDSPQVVKAGDELSLGKRHLVFISYPSEMHLWEGLLAYETSDKVLFSSDLFVVRGKEEAPVKKVSAAEALKIEARSIPADEAREKCRETIEHLDVQLIAAGHGPVLDLRP